MLAEENGTELFMLIIIQQKIKINIVYGKRLNLYRLLAEYINHIL